VDNKNAHKERIPIRCTFDANFALPPINFSVPKTYPNTSPIYSFGLNADRTDNISPSLLAKIKREFEHRIMFLSQPYTMTVLLDEYIKLSQEYPKKH